MKPYPLTDKDSIDLLMMGSVKAGFPSPAEEVREKLYLVKLLVQHSASKLCKRYPKLKGGCYMHRPQDIEKVLKNFPAEDVWGISVVSSNGRNAPSPPCHPIRRTRHRVPRGHGPAACGAGNCTPRHDGRRPSPGHPCIRYGR